MRHIDGSIEKERAGSSAFAVVAYPVASVAAGDDVK